MVRDLAYPLAAPIVNVFITDEGAAVVVDLGVEYLMIIDPTFHFLGVYQVVDGGFRGSGSTRTAMAFAVLSLFAFRAPPAYALLEWAGMGAMDVRYGIALSNVLTMVVAVAWFLRGRWQTDVVESPGPGPMSSDD